MNSKIVSQQIPLALNFSEDATFKNFFSGSNQLIVSTLRNIHLNSQERIIYLWGDSGVGKTHLLQACCHEQSLQKQSVCFIPLKHMHELKPEMLHDLENLNMIAIDDVSLLLNEKLWQESLFYLYTRIVTRNTILLIADTKPATALKFDLADLQSRLNSTLAMAIQPLTDDEKILALQQRAQARGLDLTHEIAEFLLRRCYRSMHALFAILECLDKASLSEQRKITIPFVKQILNI